ncbi:MAG: hypothetical protein ACUVV6_07275 [Thermoplasmatota archaeon]
MFGAFVKLRVEKELWERVTRSSGVEDDPGSASALFRNHLCLLSEREGLEKRVGQLERELEKERRVAADLRERLEAERRAMGEMRRELDSFWSYYRKLKSDYKAILKNPIVEEKVVIKENVAALEAMAKKRDALQSEVWELRKRVADHERARRELEGRCRELESTVTGWKGKHHAVMALLCPSAPGQPMELKVQTLSSKDYYEWRERRAEFEARRGLQGAKYALSPIDY